MAKRDYFTWQEDFTSDRCELHGYEDELVAVVDKDVDMWVAYDPNGKEFAVCATKKEAVAAAEKLLR